VFRRSRDNRWVARAELGFLPDGRRDQRLFVRATPAEAIAARDQFMAARRDGFTLPKGRQPYVSEWVEHWLHNVAKARVSPHTWHSSYRQKAEDYIVPYFGKIKLAELTEEDIEAWHVQLTGRTTRLGGPLGASTIVVTHRIFSSALKAAVTRGRMPRNPCSNVAPPQASRREIDPPTADEVQEILAACRQRPNGARWVLAVTTGLRQGEALALQWRDVRLTAPASVTVRHSAARVKGELVTKDPKSAKSRRSVPLPAVTVAALKQHREAQPVRGLRDGLVFTTAHGQPVHPRADWKDWAALLADLGLPHYRVHDARHAFATTLLEQGIDPRVVQDLMGWSTAAMAEVYQHVRPAMHARALAALDQAFGGG
jgi:integrase